MAIKVKQQVQYVKVDDLHPHPRNSRTHSPQQIQQIADSICEFGFTSPVLTDGHNHIMAGHARCLAAKQLGMTHVPVIGLKDLSPAQVKAYIIADNKLAENAGWDKELLALELQDIQILDDTFDLSLTGFELPEIDFMLMPGQEDNEEEPAVPVIDEQHVVTRSGDIWQCGRHRILCGDHLDQQDWKTLMGRHRAHAVFADPPYNVPIQGHVSGLGDAVHDEFAMAAGEMSVDEFIEYLATLIFFLTFYSRKGALHYICMDWRHQYELLVAARRHYQELKNICVWNKTNGGMGSLYRSKHEFVNVYKYGDAPHINNVELGKHGRYRTNVWDYAGNNAFHEHRNAELVTHPTVKPVAMIADAMLDCTHRNHLVIDPCVGSGSTILAGEQTQRRVFAMELEPKYVDASILRWQTMTENDAMHLASGKTFSALKHERLEVTHGEG